MIQTIVLIQNGKYPFGQVVSSKKAIKVEDIREYNTLQQLRAQRSKMQNLFNSSDKGSQTTIQQNDNINFIRLNKIYQQDLTLHFIYEYVPYSLSQYIRKRFYDEIDVGKSQIFQMNTKLFLKRMSYELGVIVNFLVKEKIKVNLEFDLLGIDQQQNLKFFIDPNCQLMISDFKGKSYRNLSASMRLIEDELREFYDHKKQEIIEKIQFQFIKIKKKQSHLPNFVIKGNNLIFENQFSEVQSECFSPCPSNMTESSFTDRCESVNSLIKKENDNIRKTHGNLFTKLKKTQSYNYNQQTETHKRLMQNKQKLQNLRQKSKKLKQDLKHSYLSNSHCFPSNPADNENKEFSRRGSTQFHNIFNKRADTQKAGQQDWRNSQIPQNLRKTHLPKGSSGKSPNRFGLKLDGMRSKSNRNHKSSFQFKPNKGKDWFNPNRSFDKGYEDDFDDKSFQQSRSIRIQVQQKTGNKERKNSFKVKILTCQQMQMDGDNVEEFVFNAMNRNFNHNKNDDDRQSSNSSRYAKQSNRSQSSKYSERFKNVFAQKFKNPEGKDQRNDDMNSKFSESPVKQYVRQKQRETSNQKNIFEKYREQFGNEKQKTGKNPVLEEKIKQAKQKAEDVLNKYMKIKKYSSKNSSKFGM